MPPEIIVCLFDLDGVLTDTAAIHMATWPRMFDEFLPACEGKSFVPFTARDDEFVDGKPRLDGVRDFLRSRGIDLPEGEAEDPPMHASVNGLGNRKNELLVTAIRKDGVRVYEGSRRYLQASRDAGLARFVVSSSANTTDVLAVTGLAALVQGQTVWRRGIR